MNHDDANNLINPDETTVLKEKLKQTEEKLQELILSRKRITSILSHDLRSPFNGILGFTNFLAEEIDTLSTDEIKTFAKNISISAKNLLALIDDLYIWTRIDTNKMQYNPISVDLKYVLSDVIFLYERDIKNKEIKISNHISENTYVYADQQMMKILFQNLISNAIKFTPIGGTVEISCNSSGNSCEVYIRDSGVGISEEELRKILSIEEHYTAKGTANEKGTGLGILICKAITGKNKGSFNITSAVNEGTTVTVSLPQAADN